PLAQRSGIRIFALGVSKQIDQRFLDLVTLPTGGKTLVSEHHQTLLRRAKELMGNQDNVSVVAEPALSSDQREYQFTIRPGTDRARITAILDQPREFRSSELTFSLSGPPTAGEMTYLVRTETDDRVAAWTAFVSTPGTYTLTVETTKPGGHKGLHLFLEALADLHHDITLDTTSPRYAFARDVRVLVQAASASGSVDAAAVKVTGTVRMTGGGTDVIPFTGLEGQFRVRDIAGLQTVVVRAETA